MTKRQIRPLAKNPNKHTQRGLRELERSVREDGWVAPITVAADGESLDGAARLEVAADVMDGIEPLVVEHDGTRPVVMVRTDIPDATTAQARRIAYRANRVAELDLDWDADVLAADVEAGLSFEGLWDSDELRELLPREAKEDPGAQVDKAAELQAKWGTALGQLWEIGEHRLMCGDCTETAVVERVMEHERAAMCFTSPPYNAGVSAQLSGNTSIGDNLYRDHYDDNRPQSEWLSLVSCALDAAMLVSDYVFFNVQLLAGNKKGLVQWLAAYSDKLADIAIWDKTHAAPQQALRVMDSRFEFVCIFSAAGNRAIGTREFRGSVHNVYVGSPQRHNENADSHGATFPVDFPEHFIQTFTNGAEIVLDPFVGSGTTIVACERLGRKCRAIEIDPGYVAVCLQRLADMGLEPRLVTS